MRIILQDQFKLLTEGKLGKDVFIKQASELHPTLIKRSITIEEAVGILKNRNIISENFIGHQPINQTGVKPKESYEVAYSKFLKESKEEKQAKAEEKTTTKAVEDKAINGYDFKVKDINNLSNQQFLTGLYVEKGDPKNSEKTHEQLIDMVVKNLSKDSLYYVKNSAFGLKGIGYSDETPGLKASKKDSMEKVKTDNDITVAKANTKDKLDAKIKSKIKDIMSMVPKTTKGVAKMDIPGKEKKINIKENQEIEDIITLHGLFSKHGFIGLDSREYMNMINTSTSKDDLYSKIMEFHKDENIDEKEAYDFAVDAFNEFSQNLKEEISFSSLMENDNQSLSEDEVLDHFEREYNQSTNEQEKEEIIEKYKTEFPWAVTAIDDVLNNKKNEFKDPSTYRTVDNLDENEDLTLDDKIKFLVNNRDYVRETNLFDLSIDERIEFLKTSLNDDDIEEMYNEMNYGIDVDDDLLGESNDEDPNDEAEYRKIVDQVITDFSVSKDKMDEEEFEDEVKKETEKRFEEKFGREPVFFSSYNENQKEETNTNITKETMNESKDHYQSFKSFLSNKTEDKPTITEAKIPVSKRLSEIEKMGVNVALETKINAIDEEISTRTNRLKMVDENADLSELVDKNQMKALRNEIKLLEKQKDKYSKLYEKITGKKKAEVIDEVEVEDKPIEEASEGDVKSQQELTTAIEDTKVAAEELDKVSQASGLSEEAKPTEDELTKMKTELESYVDMVGSYEEAVEMYLSLHPEDAKHKTTIEQLAEPMF